MVCLVGYTNAGKSTLFNAMTRSHALVEDRLFVTLHPMVRRMHLGNGEIALLSDTVGFIRKLPHSLIHAFRATLEELLSADLLLHVVDASEPRREKQIGAVEEVLGEIGAAQKPVLVVYNKVERLNGKEALLGNGCSERIGFSALTGEGDRMPSQPPSFPSLSCFGGFPAGQERLDNQGNTVLTRPDSLADRVRL